MLYNRPSLYSPQGSDHAQRTRERSEDEKKASEEREAGQGADQGSARRQACHEKELNAEYGEGLLGRREAVEFRPALLFGEFGKDSLYRWFDRLLRSRPNDVVGDERGLFGYCLPDYFPHQQIDRLQVDLHDG
jgi:hypothetical protein